MPGWRGWLDRRIAAATVLRGRAGLAAVALVLTLAACGGGPPPTPPTDSAVLPETTKVLDDATLASLTDVGIDGTFQFSSSGPVLPTVDVGDVLIVGTSSLTPMGALVQVDAITPAGNGMVLATHPAGLTDAFEELHVSAKRSVSPVGVTAQQAGVTFPIDLSASDAGGNVQLTGSLGIAPSLDLNLDIDLAAFQLDTFTLSFGASETFLANLTGSGSTAFSKSVTLGSIPFTPIVITVPTPVGAVPLVITPRVVLEAGIEGSIEGTFTASVTQEASFETSIGYQNGAWGATSDSDSDFTFDPPSYAAAASVKAMAGPRLEAYLYGAAGPFASAAAYIEASAAVDGPPPCVRGVLDAGLTAKAGMNYLPDFETTLLNEAYELDSFDTCTPGGGDRPAVGWARSYRRVGSAGENARALVQVSDGTYLVVGDSTLVNGITGTGASVWALRLDALGNVMWQKAYGGFFAIGNAVAAAEVPGGFLLATNRSVMKVDTGGNPLWVNTYEGVDIASMTTAQGGDAVLAGYYGLDTLAWAMRIDADGDVVWSRSYGPTRFHRVRATSDGGFVAIGVTPSNASDVLLVKLNANGSVAWHAIYDDRYDPTAGTVPNATLGPGTDTGMDAVELPGGGYLVVAETYGAFPIPEPTQAGHYAAWVFEVDANGAFASDTTLVHRVGADANYTSAFAAAVRPNGTSLVLGRYAPSVGDLVTNEDILMIQGSAYSRLGGGGNDSVMGGLLGGGVGAMPVTVTSDGGVIVAGTSDSFGADEEAWVVKLSRTGYLAFPYLVNTSGDSYENEDSVRFDGSGVSTDAPVAVVARSTVVEVTPVAMQVQAP